MEGRVGSGGSAKIGRSARKPAHKRYNSEMRWLKNKARRIAKQARIDERARIKKERRKANGDI